MCIIYSVVDSLYIIVERWQVQIGYTVSNYIYNLWYEDDVSNTTEENSGVFC